MMNERTGGYNQREGQACEEGFRRSWMNAQRCASRRHEKKKKRTRGKTREEEERGDVDTDCLVRARTP